MLENISLFSSLNAESLLKFERWAKAFYVDAGTILISQGAEPDNLYVVLSGRFKVFCHDADGREVLLNYVRTGEAFGELAMLDGGPRSASVMALERSQVASLSRESFLQCIREYPDVAVELLQTLSRKIRNLTDQINRIALMDVYGRVTSVLHSLAQKQADGRMMTDVLSPQDISDMVGVPKEMVVPILNDLKKAGYLAFERQRMVLKSQLPASPNDVELQRQPLWRSMLLHFSRSGDEKAKVAIIAGDNKDEWIKRLFAESLTEKKIHLEQTHEASKAGKILDGSGPSWVNQLFEKSIPAGKDGLMIIKNGRVIHELELDDTKPSLQIGRHPNADLQLEATRMSMFHAAILRKEGYFYIEDLGSDSGTLLNSNKLQAKKACQLFDGSVVELPGYQLKFRLPGMHPAGSKADASMQLQTDNNNIEAPPKSRADGNSTTPISLTEAVSAELPSFCPLHSHLIEDRDKIGLWAKGTIQLKVADIIDETADTKTFRLVGEAPLLFSYRPGQFVTLLLTIGGQELQRSYSMSSSPSRPHCLELTIKRVPGGLVSNWLCDSVKLGDKLTVKGPGGKFTCFDYPSGKMLFIAAGSGVTPLMSMSRWIADTAADVDVKFLVSAKTPDAIVFRKELELLSARHSGFRVAVTVTSNWNGTEAWTGFTGRIDRRMLDMVAPDIHERHVFICGPEAFMSAVKALLKNQGYPMQNFHSESFGGSRVVQGVETAATSGDGKYCIEFGKSGVVAKSDGRHTLLELAEKHGVEIDYSCRAGYCGECMVKCSGQVEICKECEIDAKDREAGYVYACCARPRSDLQVEA